MRILAKNARTSFHWFLFFENSHNTFWMFEGTISPVLREFIKQHNRMVDIGASSLLSHQDLLETITNRFSILATKYDLGEHNEFMAAQVSRIDYDHPLLALTNSPGHVQIEIDRLNRIKEEDY